MNILKTTWGAFKQQPVLSIISVIGTALAIFLIMVVVMMQQVKVAPFAPESNRDRLLHNHYASVAQIDNDKYQSNGPMSWDHVKQVFMSMTTPEAVAVYTAFPTTGNLSLPNEVPLAVDYIGVNDQFWKVFDFTFIDGKPFDEATFNANIPVIVITESVAKKLFGTTEVTGRSIDFDHVPYTVAGVVKDVSSLATTAYAQAWPNLSSTVEFASVWNGNIGGSLAATILAKSRDDFDAVRAEYNKSINAYNTTLKENGLEVITRNRPYDQEKDACGQAANIEPDVEGARRTRWIIYAILLIVPAVNLSSMTESRLRQRVAEIGVRRAFGAKRSEILGGLITENLLITLAAGIIGWVLSIVFAYLGSSFLFAQPFSSTVNPPSLEIGMLVQPSTFLWALLFCFALNLISSGIPAFRASRSNIVNSLSNRR